MTRANVLPSDRPLDDAGECPTCRQPMQGIIRPTPGWGDWRHVWCANCDYHRSDLLAQPAPPAEQGRLFEVT